VRTTVCDVRKAGSRVKIILSRTRKELVQRLFEQEIPEIADGVIEIRALAREPGYRSKVAVSSSDQRVDCVGACVGVRGNRIKNIVDELAGERIDIVRWSDDLEVLIPNALQPAEAEQVILCKMLGKAIVLVREDQLSLAIGRRGQNVRLGSKLCGWDIEIMTQDELAEAIDRAVAGFAEIDGVEVELAEKLVEQGFLSYSELEIIEPDDLMEIGGMTEEQVNAIVEQAESRALEAEVEVAEQRRKQREQDRVDVQEARAAEARSAEEAANAEEAASEGDADEAATEGSESMEDGSEAAEQAATDQPSKSLAGDSAQADENAESSQEKVGDEEAVQ
jgi:N utilization substance protein A